MDLRLAPCVFIECGTLSTITQVVNATNGKQGAGYLETWIGRFKLVCLGDTVAWTIGVIDSIPRQGKIHMWKLNILYMRVY
jgi:hypothetical protein